MADPYDNLANAIVLQAVKDYRDAPEAPGRRSPATRPRWQTPSRASGSSAPAGTRP